MKKEELGSLLAGTYPNRVLLYFYREFCRDLADRHPRLFPPLPPGKKVPRKTVLAQVLATVLSHQDLFGAFFQGLPEMVQRLIHEAAWHGPIPVATLEDTVEFSIFSVSVGRHYLNEEQLVRELWLFKIENANPYHYSKNDHSYLCLPTFLSSHLKVFLEKPENYHIKPVEEIPEGMIVHAEKAIFPLLELCRFFVENGQVKYASNGKNILKNSLKRFATQARVDEFYQSSDRDLDLVKSRLLLRAVQGLHGKDAPDEPLPFLVFLIDQLLKKHRLSFVHTFLDHLSCQSTFAGISASNVQEIPATLLLQTLSSLPVDAWVSCQDLWDAIHYREWDMEMAYYTNDLHHLFFYQTTEYGYQDRRGVTRENGFLLATLPFLKSAMFFFSAFGLVDIAYTEPENLKYQKKNKDYLTVYDGLKYIRLTPLGAYVLGLSPTYEGSHKEATQTEITLDSQSLLLTIKGHHPLGIMAIKPMADPIDGNRFRVDFASFLRDCGTHKDVKNQIARFRKHICKSPPPIWEAFFKTVLSRVGPLTQHCEYEVYKIDPNSELIGLLVSDPVLKANLLKAEDYHVLIEPKNRKKVRRRLKECGFLMTDP